MENKGTHGMEVFVQWVMVASSLFILYTAGFGLLSPSPRGRSTGVHVGPDFSPLPDAKQDQREDHVGRLSAGCRCAGVRSVCRLDLENDPLRLAEPSVIDTAMGMIMLVVVLEEAAAPSACPDRHRPRVSGLCVLGPFVPGSLRHKGFDVVSLVSFLYSTTEGSSAFPWALRQPTSSSMYCSALS